MVGISQGKKCGTPCSAILRKLMNRFIMLFNKLTEFIVRLISLFNRVIMLIHQFTKLISRVVIKLYDLILTLIFYDFVILCLGWAKTNVIKKLLKLKMLYKIMLTKEIRYFHCISADIFIALISIKLKSIKSFSLSLIRQ